MSTRTTPLTDALYEYMLAVSLRESPVLRRLREETAGHEHAAMQIAPEQGQFMAFLIGLLGARRALEIGTFTGYGALCMAAALPADGRLVTCETNEDWAAVGRPYWREAGVAGRIDLRLGPALETLDALIAAGEAASFDFAFIDADKQEYEAYFERTLELVRPGGVIAVDNVLWTGKAADPGNTEPDTLAIRAFNAKLHADPRVEISLVPIGDGLTLARKSGARKSGARRPA